MVATIHAAAEAIRRGKLTPVDLVNDCLARIDRYEEKVRAWVFVDRDGARAEAQRLADEVKQGRWRGPLHGIPLGIKDIFDVFDWPTGCGSAQWARSFARQDAPTVRGLRQAGAIFLGKTVTTTFASFDPPVTRNPWDLARTPGGSSSGSAAALACGMCLGALGSQTGGSITRPASFCGVAGLKPTFGRVNCDGVMPLAPSMDHPGPMARGVRDLGILLHAIAGPAPDRPTFLDPAALDRPPAPRFGRLHGPFHDLADPAVRDLMDRVSDLFRQRGAEVSDVSLPAGFAEVIPRHRILMAVEAAAYHAARLRRHPQDYPAQIRSLLEEGLACPGPEYARCKEHQQQLTREMQGCFEGVDVLLTPATTGPAPDAGSTGDPAFNSPWSYTGFPTVSLPAGRSPDGLPLGIQLVGRPWEEAELLKAGLWCEAALNFSPGDPPL